MKNGATEQQDDIEVYAFKMFWIRLANIQYSLDNFDEYQKHFTVEHSPTFSPPFPLSLPSPSFPLPPLLLPSNILQGYELHWLRADTTSVQRLHSKFRTTISIIPQYDIPWYY